MQRLIAIVELHTYFLQHVKTIEPYLAFRERVKVHLDTLLACEEFPLQRPASHSQELLLKVEFIRLSCPPPLGLLILAQDPQLLFLIRVH
jgi:hypothetical protein